MYRLILHDVRQKHGIDDIVKIFWPKDDFEIYYLDEDNPEAEYEKLPDDVVIELTPDDPTDRNDIKRKVYKAVSDIAGYTHEWGILTGVRPVKLAGELVKRYREAQIATLGEPQDEALAKMIDETAHQSAKTCLMEDYFLSEEKADLIIGIYDYQQTHMTVNPPHQSTGIYIGIPFCPTRCSYCSFTSNQAKPEAIARYFEALLHEIDGVAAKMDKYGWYPESIYIGGGTPTTLTAEQLDRLIKYTQEKFDMSHLIEYTVEAGRPDTIDEEKLQVIKDNNVGRISINPQSMKQETLEIIGRSHKPEDIERAFSQAKKVGIWSINADLIAGLQGEDEEDFAKSLQKCIDMGADNITVHTLAVKHGSRLIEEDKYFHFKQAATVRKQLAVGRKILAENGYVPYYLYRQKNMAGGLENTGYCKEDKIGIYNVRIMEDDQSIIAFGAGGVSKVYYEAENRLERTDNVSNYEIYIDRVDEMIERKDLLFEEEKEC